MRYIKQLIVITVLFAAVLLFNMGARKVDIVVEYASDFAANPEGLATFYYDNGNDFEESDSIYSTIEDGRVQFSFKPVARIKKVRIVPTRDPEQAAYLQKISVYVNDGLIKVIDGQKLYDDIDLEQSKAQVSYLDGITRISYMESEPWLYVEWNQELPQAMNCIAYTIWLRTILMMVIWLIPIALIWGVRKIPEPKWYRKYEAKREQLAFLAAIAVLWFAQGYLNSVCFLILWLLPYAFISDHKGEKNPVRVIVDLAALLFSAMLLASSQETIRILIETGSLEWSIDGICLLGSGWAGGLALIDLCEEPAMSSSKKDTSAIRERFLLSFTVICVSFTLYEWMKVIMTEHLIFNGDVYEKVVSRVTTPVYQMNLMWGVVFLLCIMSLLGKGLGTVVYGVIYSILFVGNAIKIFYHDTLLTPMDFLQLKEMVGISKTVLGSGIIIMMIVAAVGLVAVGILTRKHWLKIFRIKPDWVYAISLGIICGCFTSNVIQSCYEPRDIFYKGYENEFINERYDGFAFYNLINLSKIGEIFMSAPDDYSEEAVMNAKADFAQYASTSDTNIKPNVIMIMAESLFDIENIEELTFNQEIEPTLRQFKKGTLISPRYGGYTSAVEYEALTGLSLAFYPSGLVPYTTYFNQMDKRIPSVAAEFNDNGYVTYAIHPNDKTFYNRDIAYQELGFDTFLDKTAFTLTDDNMVAGEFLKDMPIAEKIEDLIEEHEEPVFAFAVTIAGHYMGNDRYKQTNVKVSCDLLNESERHEIEQAATAYQETDQMLQSLIEYVQASEEPTLVYIFGDHLPPLPEFSKLDYLNNAYQKYGTCLAAYSNFMEIEMPEYITPNQLAAQLMRDSGINHSSYYDYIYSLREKYPVIHSEFCTVKGNPDMDMYRMIQYDIMFGNHWFYEEKQ